MIKIVIEAELWFGEIINVLHFTSDFYFFSLCLPKKFSVPTIRLNKLLNVGNSFTKTYLVLYS